MPSVIRIDAPAASGGVEGFIAASSGTVSSGQMTLPTGSAADDLVICAQTVRDVTADWEGYRLVPSGATMFSYFSGGAVYLEDTYTVTTNTVHTFVWWKVLTATDISNGYVTSGYATPSNYDSYKMHTYRASSPITGLSPVVGEIRSQRAANPASQALSGTSATEPSINIAVALPSNNISITGGTANDETLGTTHSLHTSYYATTNEDWTVDDDGSGGDETIMSACASIST